MSSDTTPAVGSVPLGNPRWEHFAHAYAGEAFGDATKAYALAGYGARSARQCAWRLLTNEAVYARVATLRNEALRRVAMDRLWILHHRKRIVESPDSSPEAVLMALRDVEKAAGLGQPDRVAVEVSGRTEHVVAAVSPDSWKRLSEYIAEIRRDFAAARAATPAQVEERQRRLVSQGKIPGALPPAAAAVRPAVPAAKPSPQLSPAARAQLQRTILAAPTAKGGAASPTAR